MTNTLIRASRTFSRKREKGNDGERYHYPSALQNPYAIPLPVYRTPKPWRLRVTCLAVLAGGVMLALSASGAAADETRSQRCSILQNQLNVEIRAHAGSNRSANAATIGAKARKLCAGGKQAQGLRAYVKALQLLGVQPIDPK